MLAALSFAVLMQLLAKEKSPSSEKKSKRPFAEIAVIGMSLISTFGLFVTTLLSFFVVTAATSTNAASPIVSTPQLNTACDAVSRIAFHAFYLGFFGLAFTIGTAGFMHSRLCGCVTLVLGVIAIFVIGYSAQTLSHALHP